MPGRGAAARPAAVSPPSEDAASLDLLFIMH